jgi:hypothetical protein
MYPEIPWIRRLVLKILGEFDSERWLSLRKLAFKIGDAVFTHSTPHKPTNESSPHYLYRTPLLKLIREHPTVDEIKIAAEGMVEEGIGDVPGRS